MRAVLLFLTSCVGFAIARSSVHDRPPPCVPDAVDTSVPSAPPLETQRVGNEDEFFSADEGDGSSTPGFLTTCPRRAGRVAKRTGRVAYAGSAFLKFKFPIPNSHLSFEISFKDVLDSAYAMLSELRHGGNS